VTSQLHGKSSAVTTNFVKLPNPVIQGAYLDLPIMQSADTITIEVDSTHDIYRCSYYASLTEVEVYANGSQIRDR